MSRCNHEPLNPRTTLQPIRQLRIKKGEVRTEPNAVCSECGMKVRINFYTGEGEVA